MIEELKPCPFCGERHDLEVQYIDRRDREGQPVCIKCGKCGCSGPWDYCSSPAPSELEEFAAASKLWNPRHEPDALIRTVKTRINELEEQIEENCTYRSRELVNHEIVVLKWVLSLRKQEETE